MNKNSRKIGLLLMVMILSIIVVGFTAPDKNEVVDAVGIETNESGIRNVSVGEFQKLIKRGDGIILDVRTKGETTRGHLIGASFVDYYDKEFEQKIRLMQKDKPVYVYCQSGGRSYRAAQIMARNGFSSIYNLSGGYRNWTAQGFEVEKSSKSVPDNEPEISLEDFKKILKTNKAILVEFQTTWCAPCRKMSPIMDDLTKEFENKVSIIKIDADRNKSLAKFYQIKSVPAFIVFDNEKEVWRHSGTIEHQSLRNQIIEASNN